MNRNARPRWSRRSASRLSTWAWVERSSARHRLVEDDDLRVADQRPGDGDALALAAGELRRVAVGGVAGQPDGLQAGAGLGQRLGALDAHQPSGSTSVWPIVRAGLSEEYGSWKTTRRSATSRLRCLSDIDVMSCPCSFTVPDVGGCRPSTALPIVDLPEPDSPTTPSGLAGRDVEADAVDGGRRVPRLAAGAVADDEVADLQDGGRRDGGDGGRVRGGGGHEGTPAVGADSSSSGSSGSASRASSAPTSSASQVTFARASSSTRMQRTEPVAVRGQRRRTAPCTAPARTGSGVANRQPVGHEPGGGHGAGDRGQPHRHRLAVGHVRVRPEQRHRVRVRGVVQDGGGGAGLDDLAGVHDRDVVADVGDHAEVVADDDHRQAGVADERPQQAEDLGLHGDVEGGGRLVGDQQLRLTGQRQGDADALRHAAGELVRVATSAPARRRRCRPAAAARRRSSCASARPTPRKRRIGWVSW